MLEVRHEDYGVFPVKRYGDSDAFVVVSVQGERLYFTLTDDAGSAGGLLNDHRQGFYDIRMPADYFGKYIRTILDGSDAEVNDEWGEFRVEPDVSGAGVPDDEKMVKFIAPCGDRDTTVKLDDLRQVAEKFAPATA